ncbi:MAG: lipoyl synthase [Anaerolineae bacterium]|nr:lipoyl synthase [Anaerolineae bacterium]
MSDTFQPIELMPAPPRRHPDWIRVRAPFGEEYTRLKGLVRTLDLHTVCQEAMCPNIGECWGAGTLTIMILGDTCTRACRFCAVTTGNPRGIVDVDEPRRVAQAIAALDVNYVVITSVDRDDLPDGGASIFAQTVREIKELAPRTIVEVLTPDFGGDVNSMSKIVDARPEVISQNIETVRRLTYTVRDRRAGYEQTLNILSAVKAQDPTRKTKSAILLGFGETTAEVLETMRDLREHQVDLLAIGQYLRPTDKRRHYPLVEYIHPDVFQHLKDEGMKMGYTYIASGPLVRSSYKAYQAAKLFDR